MKHFIMYVLLSLTLMAGACKKDFLEKKPNKALLVPNTLTDLQALMDNSERVMNFVPAHSVLATDDIYISDDGYTATTPLIQNCYIWGDDLYQGVSQEDWNRAYRQIFYANVVLEGLAEIELNLASLQQYNAVKGTAFFSRAFAHFNIAQQFGPVFRNSTADATPGVPVRLVSDINSRSDRGTIRRTYVQIVADLLQAAELVPVEVAYKTRPSKAAVYALLARVALTMEDYGKARVYAIEALKLNNRLLDYNTLNTTANVSMPNGLTSNPEVLYYAVTLSISPLSNSLLTGISPALYQSYQADDLRKVLFFRVTNGIYNFKANYTGYFELFGGLANDEVYLILAEAEARTNNTTAAINTLNELLINRYDKTMFIPVTAAGPEDALKLILEHRRKELVYRTTRWTDLRRLNLDSRFAKTITKTVKGVIHSLPPNSHRYVFPFPDVVISTTGMEQNPR